MNLPDIISNIKSKVPLRPEYPNHFSISWAMNVRIYTIQRNLENLQNSDDENQKNIWICRCIQWIVNCEKELEFAKNLNEYPFSFIHTYKELLEALSYAVLDPDNNMTNAFNIVDDLRTLYASQSNQ